jgi:hypothetical protein
MGAGKGPESPGRLPAAMGSPAGTDEGGLGGLAQEASSTMAIIGTSRTACMEHAARMDAILGNIMVLLLLEALGALLLLVFIVWWTMFSGRKNGELKDSAHPAPDEEQGRK